MANRNHLEHNHIEADQGDIEIDSSHIDLVGDGQVLQDLHVIRQERLEYITMRN